MYSDIDHTVKLLLKHCVEERYDIAILPAQQRNECVLTSVSHGVYGVLGSVCPCALSCSMYTCVCVCVCVGGS